MVETFTSELLRADREPLDITNYALGAAKQNTIAHIIANEPGILAGIAEAEWFFTTFGLAVERSASDGQAALPGQISLRLEAKPNSPSTACWNWLNS
ncbi:MAG TPA: hypothetical protein VGI16_04960 [Candidatus Acidoferrum sp.]|jgi:nicotinate-nucleotide pyrophosphorylase